MSIFLSRGFVFFIFQIIHSLVSGVIYAFSFKKICCRLKNSWNSDLLPLSSYKQCTQAHVMQSLLMLFWNSFLHEKDYLPKYSTKWEDEQQRCTKIVSAYITPLHTHGTITETSSHYGIKKRAKKGLLQSRRRSSRKNMLIIFQEFTIPIQIICRCFISLKQFKFQYYIICYKMCLCNLVFYRKVSMI